MSKFRKKLEVLINQNSIENGSDTPDFILADYLVGCLKAFDKAVVKRSAWYGEKKNRPIPITLDQAKQLVAERFSKENWEYVVRDYDYALGISSLIGFEQIMDMVAETYKNNGLK